MDTLGLLWPALAAGLLVALVAGPLGSLLVWRRLAYFGDSLAHAALLGVGLSLLLSLPGWIGITAVCVTVAVLLALLLRHPELATDTLLTLIATTSLSLGLIAVSLASNIRVDLMAYLFGDLLGVGSHDLPLLGAAAFVTLALLRWQWDALVLASVNEELASVDGINVNRLRLLLLLLVAITVTAAMKVVGVLLITALLVIPAAAARRLARTPEHMALLASAIGMVAVVAGLGSSLQWNLPLGPAIVVSATTLFALLSLRQRPQAG
ncbi:MAG TPA: iron chelate uptake ABC transporter family permease subunit [Moraxellaceae bacterium]|nr:iron chelate uptake ABC transporter family permease subunit [Moraxellaceae bacterium]